MAHLETDTLSNQDIYNGGAGLAIGAYTLTADRHLLISVALQQIIGNGDYSVWYTRQISGAGAHIKSMVTTEEAAAGQTEIAFQSVPITGLSGDVITVYVLGVAGDVAATADTRVEFWEDPAGRLDVAGTGEAGLDFDNIKDTVGYIARLDQAISTTEDNIRGADSDDLKDLSDQLDGVSTFDPTSDDVIVGDMQAAALADFFLVDSGEECATAVDGSVVAEISACIKDYDSGCTPFTYTLTDDVTLLPIEGAVVWFTTDVGGTNIVWKGTTDVFGVARDSYNNLVCVPDGHYYVWRFRPGYEFDDPDEEDVSP